MRLLNMLMAAVLLTLAGTAHAITYVATRAVGSGTVNLSITTDNTIGVLANANITGYSITVTDPSGTFTLNPGNSGFTIAGTNFTATATSLVYDFGATSGYALFQRSTSGSSLAFYCLQINSCFDAAGPGEGLDSVNCCSSPERTARTGVFTVATAAATAGVPEPASWALLIAGFGLVGGALRRRPAGRVRVRFG